MPAVLDQEFIEVSQMLHSHAKVLFRILSPWVNMGIFLPYGFKMTDVISLISYLFKRSLPRV